MRRTYNALIARAKTPGGTARVHGMIMRLDPHDDLNLSAVGVFERPITRLVVRTVRPGMRALDIGAHIGYYTLLLAKQVGPTGHVTAFEPSPQNHALLWNNVQANKLHQVTVRQAAVADQSGTMRLYLAANTGDNRLYDSHDGRTAVEVATVALDDLLADDVPVDFIKMDIQGSEWKAFCGMRRLLQRQSVKLVTEFWPHGLRLNGADPAEYLHALEELGFRLHRIHEDGRPEPVASAAVLAEDDSRRDVFSTDLYCVREAKH
ncbi:MAG TPA: FkbM family methyltransferase [Chloroflexota bacterium]|nr:FkbM family methyltransferase [Chloroflexota bacterium]